LSVPIELFLLSVLRALIEVAGWFLIGRGVLYVLAGGRRERNPVYKLFQLLTGPVIKLTRAITPRVVMDRHVPFVALVLLFWIWVALGLVKRHLCALHQLACA
jgi:uncharacterized protein YggT (Ycf19 family)